MVSTGETAQYQPAVEVLTALTDADVQDYARLLPQLSSTPRTEDEIRQNMQRTIESPSSRTVVIRDEQGRIQASATGNLCPIPTGYKPWVDDVMTDEAHRKKGYGGMLMESLHSWFQEVGVPYVNLTSTPDKEAAGNLYERLGYAIRNTRVYRLTFGLGAAATKG